MITPMTGRTLLSRTLVLPPPITTLLLVRATTSYPVSLLSDGSKTLEMRPLKLVLPLSATPATNQSLTLDVAASNININDLNTNTFGVSTGGTGANTAANARTNLGAAKSGANTDISALSGLTTVFPIAQGGTGAMNSISSTGQLGRSEQRCPRRLVWWKLVHSTQTLVSGAYRAELKGLKPATGNTITVTTDGSDVAIGANANNIPDAVTGARNINGARITGAGAPINDSDLAIVVVNSVAQGPT